MPKSSICPYSVTKNGTKFYCQLKNKHVTRQGKPSAHKLSTVRHQGQPVTRRSIDAENARDERKRMRQ